MTELLDQFRANQNRRIGDAPPRSEEATYIIQFNLQEKQNVLRVVKYLKTKIEPKQIIKFDAEKLSRIPENVLNEARDCLKQQYTSIDLFLKAILETKFALEYSDWFIFYNKNIIKGGSVVGNSIGIIGSVIFGTIFTAAGVVADLFWIPLTAGREGSATLCSFDFFTSIIKENADNIKIDITGKADSFFYEKNDKNVISWKGGRNPQSRLPYEKRRKIDLYTLAKSKGLKVTKSSTKETIILLLRGKTNA